MSYLIVPHFVSKDLVGLSAQEVGVDFVVVLANHLSKCVALLTISCDQVWRDMEKQATNLLFLLEQ
jgi:hypothetical protein